MMPGQSAMSAAILTTFEVEEHRYIVEKCSKTQIVALEIPLKSIVSDYWLATAIDWDQAQFTDQDLDQVKNDFCSRDDVWTLNFLEVIIIRAHGSLNVNLVDHKAAVVVALDKAGNYLPNGPYVVQKSTGSTFAISKLYADGFQAFIGGGLRNKPSNRTFEWLHTDIAVPSRLYYQASDSMPLAGLRFAVKDVIDIAGLETGCGSRSFMSICAKKDATAPFVDRLIDKGAVLVGKLKTSQFADGQRPSEWFDYIAPFNPRGDGYQSPSSSSSGPAAACAGYDWLDFTIGTDTGGSIRHPAGVNGLYGTRTSINSISTRGFIVSSLLDVVGVFARSATVLQVSSDIMVDPMYRIANWPTVSSLNKRRYKLLYPIRAQAARGTDSLRWFPYPGVPGIASAAEDKFETIIQQLEQHLGCTRHPFNLEELWRETHPAEESEDLNKATGTMYQDIVYGQYVPDTIDTFINDYMRAHDQRKPFIEPIVARRQNYGRNVTSEQTELAKKSLKTFGKWVLDVIFNIEDADTFPLLVFPQTWGRPDYRTDYPPAESKDTLFYSAFSTYSISYASGCPDFTVPVGQVPFQSVVSGREEHLPISLSMLTRPKADGFLLQLVKELEDIGILNSVSTGNSI